jgi:hypothetical protein
LHCIAPLPLSRELGTLAETRSAPAVDGGCRIKPVEKTRSALAEAHVRAAVHDALATDYLCATDEMGVFGTHPYKRSSGRAGGFPDNHDEQQKHTLAALLFDGCESGAGTDRPQADASPSSLLKLAKAMA